MAFNCTSPRNAVVDHHVVVSGHHGGGGHGHHGGLERPETLDRQHSAFGDAYSVKSRSTGSLATFSRYHDEPEADYDEGATELYRRIENKDWDGALSRLEMAPIEAKTWVSRREHNNSNKTRWRLLPLHAVCIFRAPLALIEALIEVYGDGPQMKDDQGMLPIHLACRNGASKGVVLTLASAFPDSVHVRDRKDRSPIDLVENSQSANREAVLLALRRFRREVEQQQQKQSSAAGGNNSNGSSPPSGNRGGSSRRSQQQAPPPPSHSQSNQYAQVASGGGGGGGAAATAGSRKSGSSAPSNADNHVPVPAQAGGVFPDATQQQQPGSEPEVDYEHRTVLFRLVLKKDWKAASARASAFPEEAATWIVTKGFNGNLRFLPIHKACVLLPPESVVTALLRAFPAGAQSRDQDGWLPIHCACFYGSSDDVVRTLLKEYPKGAQSKDDEGRLPLHYACLKGASQAAVDLLLAAFAKGAMSKDDEGRLALHHACSKGAPEGVIDALLKASPKGAQSKDDQGRLPLHHACRKSASERVLRTLLRVYPRAAQIKDDQDKLPLHYACQHAAASPAVVHLLLQTYPESINVQNGFGYTPLAEARGLNTKNDAVLKVLEKFKREQDKIRQETGEQSALEGKLAAVQDRVAVLERLLGKVGDLGRDVQHAVRKDRDPVDVLELVGDRLVEIAKAASSKQQQKTPLKSRQATPVKSMLFGRGKNKDKDKNK